MNLRTFTVCWLAMLLSPIAVAVGAVVYVDDDAPGGDGTSWATAFSHLQDALAAADANDEIRVAQGTYVPDRSTATPHGSGDRAATFMLITGVTMKGGWAGLGGLDSDARDVSAYETVLSGDLDDDDGADFANNDENSYHVVSGSGTDPNAVMDGFVVTAGNATDWWGGGGMQNHKGSPTVIDCKFVGNSSAYRGGGMSNIESGLSLTGCTFKGNFSCTDGGAIYDHHAGSTLTNCIIIDNVALCNGGGIGADDLCDSDLVLANCTIVGNEADEYGGGVFVTYNCRLYLANSILWDNIAYEGPQMAIRSDVDAFIRYSCFQGGELDIFSEWYSEIHWGDGNTDADPRFADVSAGDYHLKSQVGRWDPNDGRWTMDEVTSPCIDAGDPNSDWTVELWPHGKRINMGVFGGTAQASMSDSSLGNRADLDNSGSVNFGDFARVTEWWRAEGPLRAEDLNRDAIVDFFDVVEFVEEWLWQADWHEP